MAGIHAGQESTASRLTYEDYLQLPDDGKRYEILDGELAVTPSPRVRHQRVSGNLYRLLDEWSRRTSRGEVFYAPIDVILADTTVTVPDLVWVSAARSGVVTERAIEGPPDLVVEILSPSTRHRDRGIKRKLYARHGVLAYAIVDPDARTVETFALEGDAYRAVGRFEGDTTATLPGLDGLVIDLAHVWV